MSNMQAALAEETQPVATAPQKQKIKMNRFQYDGKAGKIFGIWVVNFFMKIITLGIYSFWGKTRMRKYIASSFSLGGDRFEYTGTGMELFKGFLKALPIILVLYGPFIVLSVIPATQAIALLFLIPIVYVVPAAIFMSLRYRLSRTTWRGIRGSVGGSAIKYANLSLRRMFVNIISLGLFIPYSDMAKHKYIVENASFGNVKAEFKSSAKSLMKTHIITLLLMVPTLGLSRLWYRAALQRAKMGGITVGDLRFKSNVTAMNILMLILSNLLILGVTLGLGMPIIINRNMKFMAAHNAVGGNLDTAQIMQGRDQKISVGEGLDDALGLDAGLLG